MGWRRPGRLSEGRRVMESGPMKRVEYRPTLTDTGFPSDFVWGAATAAYQIEGAAR